MKLSYVLYTILSLTSSFTDSCGHFSASANKDESEKEYTTDFRKKTAGAQTYNTRKKRRAHVRLLRISIGLLVRIIAAARTQETTVAAAISASCGTAVAKTLPSAPPRPR